MDLTTDDLKRMERLHVRAWPATETATIQGWLWRWSGGGSQRANSVSTIDFTGDDPAAALDEVESRYRAKGMPARLHTFAAGAPATLPTLLHARGYRDGEATLTLFKPVQPAAAPADVAITDHPTAAWKEVYLGAITPDRRDVNARILDRIPHPRAFFACLRDGRAISTALCVAGYGCAVAECVATRRESRRQGGADAVMRAVEAWAARQGAALLGLQVVAGNHPARALYDRLGYIAGAENRFWVRPSVAYQRKATPGF